MPEPFHKHVVTATGEAPAFAPGNTVRVGKRAPVGHYRVPIYLRGRKGRIVKVIEPTLVDNEEEAYGRNAGNRRHYYRIAVAMPDIWPGYEGSARDELHIEVYETWLEALS